MTHHNSRAARGVATTSAFLLVLASAGFGALFAWTTGSKHGPLLGALSVAMALGLEGAKPFAVAGAFNAFGRWQLGQGLALASVGTLAVLFSLTAELTFMAMARGDLVAERSGGADSARKAEARYVRAEAELQKLAPARPASELAPEIAKLKATPGANACNKVNGKISREVCAEVADLEAESARDARRRELEATMREAESERAAAPPIVVADPGAAALAVYAASLGVTVSPEVLSMWLPLVGVLALEIGSAFGVLLVRAAGPVSHEAVPGVASNRASQASPVSHEDAAPPALVAVALGVPRPAQPCTSCPKTKDDDDPSGPRQRAMGELLERLKTEGGELTGTTRGLAKLIGTSRGTVHRAIADAVAAGMVRVEATMSGTRIALA